MVALLIVFFWVLVNHRNRLIGNSRFTWVFHQGSIRVLATVYLRQTHRVALVLLGTAHSLSILLPTCIVPAQIDLLQRSGQDLLLCRTRIAKILYKDQYHSSLREPHMIRFVHKWQELLISILVGHIIVLGVSRHLLGT